MTAPNHTQKTKPESQTRNTKPESQITNTMKLLKLLYGLWLENSEKVIAEEPLPPVKISGWKIRKLEDEELAEEIDRKVQELVGPDDYFRVVILGVDIDGDPYILLI